MYAIAYSDGPDKGLLWISTDSGDTWNPCAATPQGRWQSVACSADGVHVVIADESGRIWTSHDAGVTAFNSSISVTDTHNWLDVACSSDGMNLIACVGGLAWTPGDIWTSVDGGATWADRKTAGTRSWIAVASSTSGLRLAACEDVYSQTKGYVGGHIWTSQDGGLTWKDCKAAGTRAWSSIASSADGSYLVACAGRYLCTSFDGGTTWTTLDMGEHWIGDIACSADGKMLVGCGDFIYTSKDYGASIAPQVQPGFSWQQIASSADGKHFAAIGKRDYELFIFTSSDGGSTWINRTER